LRRVISRSWANYLGFLQTVALHRREHLLRIFPMSKQQMPVMKCFPSYNTCGLEELCVSRGEAWETMKCDEKEKARAWIQWTGLGVWQRD
jgi:hypothetical protein